MEWMIAWFAFSLAAGAFYQAHEVKKENESLQKRLLALEEEVFIEEE